MNIDQYGLPISQGDGGDSLHHYFTSSLRQAIIMKEKVAPLSSDTKDALRSISLMQAPLFALFEVSPGVYVRHPDPSKWYSDPRNTSRDQLTAVIAFTAYCTQKMTSVSVFYRSKLEDLFLACLKRGMFAQNIHPNWVDPRTQTVKRKIPDFLTPDLWTLFARGLLGWWSLPINLFLDVFILLSVLFKLWAPITKDGLFRFRMPGPDDTDDDNMHNVIMVAQYVAPTPWSWLSRKLFKRFRSVNNGNLWKNESDPMMGALVWYYRADIGGNSEFAEIARPILEKY